VSASEVHDFNELCRSPTVRAQLETIETNRTAALRNFGLLLVGAVVAAAAAAYILNSTGLSSFSFIAAGLIFFIGIAFAYTPLAKVGQSLKQPVLETLAARSGMEYLPSQFAPPLYPEAKKALFGSWLSGESFTDLFNGKDDRGRGIAIYEASLQKGSGRSRHTVFSGQVYALQKPGTGSAVTVIVPDRGLFNFFKPSGGFDRVRLDDEEFERRFEVYSTDEVSAKQLLFSSTLRRLLLDLGQGGRKGKVLAYFGPEGVLVAAAGPDRFEPGSMFRSKRGEERARTMFDDYCGSIAVLNNLRSALG
jgi:hypothetical protein